MAQLAACALNLSCRCQHTTIGLVAGPAARCAAALAACRATGMPVHVYSSFGIFYPHPHPQDPFCTSGTDGNSRQLVTCTHPPPRLLFVQVVYINTSLKTKALAHAQVPTITCTSSNVVQTVLQAFAQVGRRGDVGAGAGWLSVACWA